MSDTRLPLAVSLGDPSGIGPDILLKAWAKRLQNPIPDFFVAGDISFLAQRASHLDLDIEFIAYQTGDEISNALPVLDIGHPLSGIPNAPDIKDAAATIKSINRCVELVLEKKANAIVTCPINKHIVYQAGFAQPGHTEYLAELAAQHTGETVKPVMMIAAPQLRTVPVTIHIPLHHVPSALTTENIVETCRIVARDLHSRFGITSPRLAVSGLNPHAGENGSLGLEDDAIVRPAILQLNSEGVNAFGPLPADTMFHEAARKTYDAAICMYHDQALIPAKTLAFDDGVNITLGLPFIRTSPDHGTAYDIAGTGKANPSSFIAALKMADEMGRNS